MAKKLDKIDKRVYTLQYGEGVVKKHPPKPKESFGDTTEGNPRSFQSTNARKGKEIAMMAHRFASLRGIKLVFAFVLAALVAACGGGGASDNSTSSPTVGVSIPTNGTNAGTGVSTPSNTGNGIKQIQEVQIKFVTVGGVNINGTTVDPTVKVEVAYNAGGTTGAGILTTVCGDQQLVGTLESATPEKLVFTHDAWKSGSCSGTATVSAAGYTSATQNFTFTTKEAAKPTFDYVVAIAGDLGTPFLLSEDPTAIGGIKAVEFVNKTSYQRVALCAVATIGTDVWIGDDGYPRYSCQVPLDGNSRKLFISRNPGEISEEDTTTTLAADTVLRDVVWRDSSNNIHGWMAPVGSQVASLTDAGMHIQNKDGVLVDIKKAQFLLRIKSK